MKFKNIFEKKEKKNLILLFIFLCFASALELLSLGFVPVFISSILNENLFINFISKYLNIEIINYVSENKIIIFAASVLIFFFVIKNILLIFIIYFRTAVQSKIRRHFRSKIIEYNLNKNYQSFIRKRSSEFLREVNLDAGQATVVVASFINIIKEGLVLILIFSSFFFIDYKLVIALTIFFGLFSFLFYYLTKNHLRRNSVLIKNNLTKVNRAITEIYSSMKDILIYNAKDEVSSEFNKNQKIMEKYGVKNTFISSLPRIYFEIISVLSLLILVIYFINDKSTTESLLLSLSFLAVCIIRTLPSISLISTSAAFIKSNSIHFKHLSNIINELKEDKLNKKNGQKNNNTNISFKNNIVFENVNFSYDEKNINLIDNISLEIKKKDKTGIIGITGSGKSTIINLILGLIKPSRGIIRIDNNDLSFNLIQWQKKIGFVSQENLLLDDTILKNITFTEEISKYNEDLINKCIETSEIKELIENLPLGLNTQVGERGTSLSSGQKQRINIARALYREPEILIFDEGTSNLDLATEKRIFNNLEKNFTNTTIIVVSHRKDTLELCNNFYLINQGKVSKVNKENLNSVLKN